MTTAQFVWRIVRAYPILASLSIGLAIVIAALDLLPGLVTERFFTVVSQPTVGADAETMIVLLLSIALARTLIKTNSVLVADLHQFIASATLRRNLLANILARPSDLPRTKSVGESISRFRDDAAQCDQFVALICYGVSLCLFAIGATVVLLRIDPLLTACVFLPLIATVIVVQRALGRVAHYRQASREATGKVTETIGEIFGSVQAIQVAGAETAVVARLQALNEERRQFVLRDVVLNRSISAITRNLESLGTGLLLLLGARAISAGSFTIGNFAAFVYYLGFVGEFTRFFGHALAGYRQTTVSLNRLTSDLHGAAPVSLTQAEPLFLSRSAPTPTASTIAPTTCPLLTLTGQHLTHHYPSTGRGITDLSFQITRGEMVVIAGRVGAGKTTFLRVLLGQLSTQRGQILWNGQPLTDPATWFVPPQVAYLPQAPHLFSATLRDNILLGSAETTTNLTGALQRAVMEEDLAALPTGLETQIGARGARLSGGQAQRTAAARAFVRPAELLLLDDLASALDVVTERILWARLKALPDLTLLAVSNRRATLQQVDRILVLHEGRIIAEGALATLLATCPEMQRLWDQQPDQPTVPR